MHTSERRKLAPENLPLEKVSRDRLSLRIYRASGALQTEALI